MSGAGLGGEIGAGIGFVKGLSDQEEKQKKSLERAVDLRVSPWMGVGFKPTEVPEANMLQSVATGALGGVDFGAKNPGVLGDDAGQATLDANKMAAAKVGKLQSDSGQPLLGLYANRSGVQKGS